MNYELFEKYINDFGFSIIPVAKDKRPIGGWAEFQKRRISPQELKDTVIEFTKADAGKEEFKKLARFQGIGVVTGQISNITVLDFDLSSEDTEWYSIFSEMNIPTVKTVSGGRHFYFNYSTKLYTLATKIHIDVRNDGGFVVMPPSRVELKDKTLGSYSWIKDLTNSLVDIPTEFYSWFKSKNQISDKFVVINKPPVTLEGASEGTRNQKATQVAGLYINSHRGDLDLAWGALQNWNLQRNNPPLDEKELRATFNSIAKKDSINNPEVKVAQDINLDNLLDFTMREELPIGIPEFDFKFRFPAGFYVISGTPGSGKGWFALWLTRLFWERHKKKSIYFSLEMTEQLVRQRYLQSWSDLTEEQFKQVVTKKDYSKIQKAMSMVQEKIMIVDEFGGSDTKLQTPENFKILFEKYYQMGYRIFHFDHFHQLAGTNVNDKNQEATEKWGYLFQGLAKEYPDTWLFIFAQPKGSVYKSRVLSMEDISGSKSIIQKCEIFLSLNKNVKIDETSDNLKIENDTRVVDLYMDKNRLTSHPRTMFNLYNLNTGNFCLYEDFLRGDALKMFRV